MDEDRKERKLFDSKYLIIISLLFTFLPASILYAYNFKKFGLQKQYYSVLYQSLFLFTFMMIIKGPLLALSLGYGAYMYVSQGRMVRIHQSYNGNVSNKLVLGLILCFVFFDLLILLYYFFDRIIKLI